MRIEHIAIWADDIELLRDFYLKYFNLTCGDKYTNPAKKFTSYFLSFGEDKTRIELMNIPDMENPASRTLAIPTRRFWQTPLRVIKDSRATTYFSRPELTSMARRLS